MSALGDLPLSRPPHLTIHAPVTTTTGESDRKAIREEDPVSVKNRIVELAKQCFPEYVAVFGNFEGSLSPEFMEVSGDGIVCLMHLMGVRQESAGSVSPMTESQDSVCKQAAAANKKAADGLGCCGKTCAVTAATTCAVASALPLVTTTCCPASAPFICLSTGTSGCLVSIGASIANGTIAGLLGILLTGTNTDRSSNLADDKLTTIDHIQKRFSEAAFLLRELYESDDPAKKELAEYLAKEGTIDTPNVRAELRGRIYHHELTIFNRLDAKFRVGKLSKEELGEYIVKKRRIWDDFDQSIGLDLIEDALTSVRLRAIPRNKGLAQATQLRLLTAQMAMLMRP